MYTGRCLPQGLEIMVRHAGGRRAVLAEIRRPLEVRHREEIRLTNTLRSQLYDYDHRSASNPSP